MIELTKQLDCSATSIERERQTLVHQESACRQLCDEMKRYQEVLMGLLCNV
jgi:hypothetical protein